jgi:hypothetical protein
MWIGKRGGGFEWLEFSDDSEDSPAETEGAARRIAALEADPAHSKPQRPQRLRPSGYYTRDLHR